MGSYHWRTGQAGQEVERGQSKTEKDTSEISVGLDRENRVHGRSLVTLQPPGGKDHLSDCNNNCQGEKVTHRITQPPGGKSSDIFGLKEENGNILAVEGKPYKMASSFELGDEQPDNGMERSSKIPIGTFHSLFGPPSPVLSKAEKARLNANQPSDYSVKPSKKPLPVNPWTGDVLGLPGVKSPEAPRRQSTVLPVNPLTGDIIGNPGQKAPETPKKEYNPDSIPPGGRSTPIW